MGLEELLLEMHSEHDSLQRELQREKVAREKFELQFDGMRVYIHTCMRTHTHAYARTRTYDESYMTYVCTHVCKSSHVKNTRACMYACPCIDDKRTHAFTHADALSLS